MSTKITLYGLKNCDSCRKAFKAIKQAGKTVELIDIRESPVPKATLIKWFKLFGYDKLLNRRSTTWRTLSDTEKAASTQQDVVALLIARPALMKRPVIVKGALCKIGADTTTLEYFTH